MPPFNRYGGAGRYNNKKRFRGLWKRKGTAIANKYLKPTWRRVVKTVNKLKNTVNAEMKQFSVDGTFTAGGGQIACINGIDQGDGHDDRDGLSVRMKYVHVKILSEVNASQTGAPRIRLSLVLKKNNQGAAPSYTDVYATGGLARGELALREYNGIRNFWVIRDLKPFSISYTAAFNRPAIMVSEFYVPIDVKTRWEYGQTGGGAADIQTNGLYLFAYDSSTTNFSTIAYVTRVGFYDN